MDCGKNNGYTQLRSCSSTPHQLTMSLQPRSLLFPVHQCIHQGPGRSEQQQQQQQQQQIQQQKRPNNIFTLADGGLATARRQPKQCTNNWAMYPCGATTPDLSSVRTRSRHYGDGQVLDGSSRRPNTASMPAERAQANQGVGKVPKPIPASLGDTPARKLWKALSRTASRQNGVRDQAAHLRKQQTARPHSVH